MGGGCADALCCAGALGSGSFALLQLACLSAAASCGSMEANRYSSWQCWQTWACALGIICRQ